MLGVMLAVAAALPAQAAGADTTPPTFTLAPQAWYTVGGQVSYGRQLPISVNWRARDAGSGVAGYRVQWVLTSGYTGFWQDDPPRFGPTTEVFTDLPVGHYQPFRAKATDRAGNTSAWRYGPAYTLSVQQENAELVTATGWTRVYAPGSMGGFVLRTSAPGSTVVLELPMRAFGLLMTLAPGQGSVEVAADGSVIKTLSLAQPFVQRQTVVLQRHWSAKSTHRIRVRSLGDGPVELDAFLLIT
jgi:hypothetical protein